MRSACWASGSGSFMCDIMRNPETSMPRSRALAMCCAATSASVQWVATRTDVTPSEWACTRSSMVPIPGTRSTVSAALSMIDAASSIHSQSVWAPKP